jgi:hypothetical protein
MDTEPGTRAGTATPTLAREVSVPDDAAAPRPNSGVAAKTGRGFLGVLLVLIAPLALMVWAVIPRLTSPSELASQAVTQDLTSIVRDAIVDELSAQLSERRNAPTVSDQMRLVFDRSMTQAWFDEQVVGLATELDRWLAGNDDDPPELVIDLRPVKASLTADPEALLIVAAWMGGEEFDGTVAAALTRVPDEVELFSAETDSEFPEGFYAVREILGSARSARQMIPVVLVIVFAIFVVLARPGERLRSSGRLLAVIGGSVAIASFAMPFVATRLALGAAPGDLPIEASQVEGLMWWMMAPLRPIGVTILVAGVVAMAAAYASVVMQRRKASGRLDPGGAIQSPTTGA